MLVKTKVLKALFVAASLVLLSRCQYNLETRFLADPGGDATPPTIIEVLPARGAHLETISTASITYSEDVVGADSLSNYSFSGLGINNLSIDSIDVMGANTYRLNISGTAVDGTINIDVAGVIDIAGNSMVPDSITYLGWWDTDWSHRTKLSFDKFAPPSNLTNFAAMVKLGASEIDYSAAGINGEDLRFVDSNRNAMSHEIEVWDPAGTSTLWMRVPLIPAGSLSTHVWMYYGNSSAADNQDIPGTWDADFGLVWHLDDSAAATDSTSNVRNGVNNFATAVATDSGRGYSLNGTTAWINPGGIGYLISALVNRTVEFRFKADRTDQLTTIYEEGGGSNGLVVGFDDISGDSVFVTSLSVSSGGPIRTSSELFSDTGSYHYVAGVFDGSNSELRLYLDGVLSAPVVIAYPSIAGHSGLPGIGQTTDNDSYGNNSTGNWFDGILDEVRISHVARGDDWIAAQNLSMNDSFITYTQE